MSDTDTGGREGRYRLEPSLRKRIEDAIERMTRKAAAPRRKRLRVLRVEVRERGGYRLERSDRIKLREIGERLATGDRAELDAADETAIHQIADRAAGVDRAGPHGG